MTRSLRLYLPWKPSNERRSYPSWQQNVNFILIISAYGETEPWKAEEGFLTILFFTTEGSYIQLFHIKYPRIHILVAKHQFELMSQELSSEIT